MAKIINENHIKVKVWERGAGLTKACGTAACATAFAAKINGKIKNKTEIEFELGKLSILIDENKNISMTGPVSNIDQIKKNYKLEKYIILFPFCSAHLIHKKWPHYNELIDLIGPIRFTS